MTGVLATPSGVATSHSCSSFSGKVDAATPSNCGPLRNVVHSSPGAAAACAILGEKVAATLITAVDFRNVRRVRLLFSELGRRIGKAPRDSPPRLSAD